MRDAIQPVQAQPLLDEMLRESLCARVGQHSIYLRVQDGWIFERAFPGELQQLQVGHARPEKERKPTRQFLVTDRSRSLCILGGWPLSQVEELRRSQDRGQYFQHRPFKRVKVRTIFGKQVHKGNNFPSSDRTSPGALQEASEYFAAVNLFIALVLAL